MRTDINKASGMWEGKEVEATQFYGLRTLFICRWDALGKIPINDYPHYYFDLTDPDFSVPCGQLLGGVALSSVVSIVRFLIEGNKKVTVNVPSGAEMNHVWTEFRLKMNFCLLITLTLPDPAFGSYAVKVVPPVPFNSVPACRGVYVAVSDKFKFTPWSAYEGDKDV